MHDGERDPVDAHADRKRVADASSDLRRRGIRRIRSFAWRDLEHADAGAPERYVDAVYRRWAAAGLDVEHRTSAIGTARTSARTGYWVVRRGTRRTVVPRVMLRELLRPADPTTAYVEVWNGRRWWSPLWASGLRMVWACEGDLVDTGTGRGSRLRRRSLRTRLTTRRYRRLPIAAPSTTAATELAARGIDPNRITVVPPGAEPVPPGADAAPDRQRAAEPTVVIAGPPSHSRPGVVLRQLQRARNDLPELTVDVFVRGVQDVSPGDADAPTADNEVRSWIAAHDAASWVRLVDSADAAARTACFERAWLITSAATIGWGLDVLDAASFAVPAVATWHGGHAEAVVDGRTGRLVDEERLGDAIVELLRATKVRLEMGERAQEFASGRTWEAAAATLLELLLDEQPPR